jgi:hypothetical protein
MLHRKVNDILTAARSDPAAFGISHGGGWCSGWSAALTRLYKQMQWRFDVPQRHRRRSIFNAPWFGTQVVVDGFAAGEEARPPLAPSSTF